MKCITCRQQQLLSACGSLTCSVLRMLAAIIFNQELVTRFNWCTPANVLKATSDYQRVL
jgi:hypothetical protein